MKLSLMRCGKYVSNIGRAQVETVVRGRCAITNADTLTSLHTLQWSGQFNTSGGQQVWAIDSTCCSYPWLWREDLQRRFSKRSTAVLTMLCSRQSWRVSTQLVTFDWRYGFVSNQSTGQNWAGIPLQNLLDFTSSRKHWTVGSRLTRGLHPKADA